MKDAISLGIGGTRLCDTLAHPGCGYLFPGAGVHQIYLQRGHGGAAAGDRQLSGPPVRPEIRLRQPDLGHSRGQRGAGSLPAGAAEPGDEVIIPVPSFVCYGPLTEMAGGVPVYVELKAENQFRLTPEQLKAAITPQDQGAGAALPPPTPPAALWSGRTWRLWPRCCGTRRSWWSPMKSMPS